MKVLIVTTSRADWNGLGMVARELTDRGAALWVCAYTPQAPEWCDAITEDCSWYDYGNGGLIRACTEFQPDVALVAGDRSELLEACVLLCKYKVPIAHIAGGDVTLGSMDDRYRDAITSLSTIHFTTTNEAFHRILRIHDGGHRNDDVVRHTGSPAIDRIKQTKLEPVELPQRDRLPLVLLSIHPNTVDYNPLCEIDAVIHALLSITPEPYVVALGANDDPGGHAINIRLATSGFVFFKNLPPAQYYWLLANCDVMVGNSSAMLYEAPSFGTPCVMVGQRQLGRTIPDCVYSCPDDLINTPILARQIEMAMGLGRVYDWVQNPYGDGKSAPRIVAELEEWHELRQRVGGRARVTGDAV